MCGKSWGNPSFIDEVYLRNPMEPPDVLGMAQDPGPAPKLPDRKKSELLIICVYYIFILCKILNLRKPKIEKSEFRDLEMAVGI